MTLKMNEMIKRSGRRKNRDLAILDSNTAIARQKMPTFAIRTAMPITTAPALATWAIPKGKKDLTPAQ